MRTFRMTVEIEVKFDGVYEKTHSARAKELVEREIDSYVPRSGMEFTEARVTASEMVVSQ